MSIQQLVFGVCLSGFVPLGKNYIQDVSIRGNIFEILTVNHCEVCLTVLKIVGAFPVFKTGSFCVMKYLHKSCQLGLTSEQTHTIWCESVSHFVRSSSFLYAQYTTSSWNFFFWLGGGVVHQNQMGSA